jgi:hypothetical protein
MKRERKSRIWQLITICAVVFLAAFSLPFHASAVVDVNDGSTYDMSYWSEGEIGLWNWMHNDFKNPMGNEFAHLESLIQTSGVDSAASTETLNNIQTKVDSIDVAKDLQDFYDAKENAGSTEDMFAPVENTNSQVGGANLLWKMVGKVMENGGNLTVLDTEGTEGVSLGIDVSMVTSDYNAALNGFMRLFAYSLVLLFFSVNLIESTVKYELVSIKGAVVFGGRLILGKLMIDLSTTICVKVVDIITWVCGNLAETGYAEIDILAIEAKKPSSSALWVIGKIVDFFNAITNSWLVAAIALVITIISIAILIKLLIRNIQLAIFVIVAPPFFATLATETTKRYFHNYFTAFLQCALQVVFMCIVWYVGILLLNGHQIAGDAAASFLTDTSLYRTLIIYICMGILICKPPRFLTNALN